MEYYAYYKNCINVSDFIYDIIKLDRNHIYLFQKRFQSKLYKGGVLMKGKVLTLGVSLFTSPCYFVIHSSDIGSIYQFVEYQYTEVVTKD